MYHSNCPQFSSSRQIKQLRERNENSKSFGILNTVQNIYHLRTSLNIINFFQFFFLLFLHKNFESELFILISYFFPHYEFMWWWLIYLNITYISVWLLHASCYFFSSSFMWQKYTILWIQKQNIYLMANTSINILLINKCCISTFNLESKIILVITVQFFKIRKWLTLRKWTWLAEWCTYGLLTTYFATK